MFDSNRLLDTILDRLLRLLPAEPAAFKRLDDIGDAEPDLEVPEALESELPQSAVHARPLRAAS